MPTPTPESNTDYYALLGVDPGAESVTIRKAWVGEQRLWVVRQNAPDLAARQEAERHVLLLAQVKDVLLDPVRRATYDRDRVQLTVALPASPAPPVADLPDPVGYAARHPDTLNALAVGVAGGLVTGSQVFHWNFPLEMAITLALGVPVYAFDVLGLRSVAWVFGNRARGAATWLALLELTLGFGLWAVADLDSSAATPAIASAPVATRTTAASVSRVAPARPAPTYAPRVAPTAPRVAAFAPTPTREITLPDGLRYTDVQIGTGQVALAGMSVLVNYTGWLADGTMFDNTRDRDEPFAFTLGRGQVLKGWDEGVGGMKVGGTRQLIIPGDLGFGPRGAGDGLIPPNATLTYEIELLDLR